MNNSDQTWLKNTRRIDLIIGLCGMSRSKVGTGHSEEYSKRSRTALPDLELPTFYLVTDILKIVCILGIGAYKDCEGTYEGTSSQYQHAFVGGQIEGKAIYPLALWLGTALVRRRRSTRPCGSSMEKPGGNGSLYSRIRRVLAEQKPSASAARFLSSVFRTMEFTKGDIRRRRFLGSHDII